MSRQVTIVMYHYVRELVRSRFPAIKGQTTERFRRQLDYLQTHYAMISAEDLLEAMADPQRELPPNPVLLTFDDGYSDHFANVFPLLVGRGMRGCFFPPAQAILEHKVLDVNKIHFVLASTPNVHVLLSNVFSYVDEFRVEYALKSKEDYLSSIHCEHRYDTPEVVLLKRLLQRELPERVRAQIIDRLFQRYVTSDEVAFACELYMSVDQIKCLRQLGMHIGSHGYTHAWLNHLSPIAQSEEIDKSLKFLQVCGVDMEKWTMCYPYGGYNDSLLEILRQRKCQIGFTVEPCIANLDRDNRLTLSRLDTNDLPS